MSASTTQNIGCPSIRHHRRAKKQTNKQTKNLYFFLIIKECKEKNNGLMVGPEHYFVFHNTDLYRNILVRDNLHSWSHIVCLFIFNSRNQLCVWASSLFHYGHNKQTRFSKHSGIIKEVGAYRLNMQNLYTCIGFENGWNLEVLNIFKGERHPKTLFPKIIHFLKSWSISGPMHVFSQNCSKELKHFSLVLMGEGVVELRPKSYHNQYFPCCDL